MAPGTIVPTRAAVLRGRVLNGLGTPLPGIVVSILSHPELGQTQSRSDGWFDLAVNGGGLLTVQYENAGYLPVQRQAQAPWQDLVVLPDVVMILRDTQATTVDLTASVPMQVAQGNLVTDADGTRQAALLIPQGTQAWVLQPDGSTQAVSTLTLRLTEYTVGPDGPKRMPAPLPPNSAYTYAIELGADEAIAKLGGKDVLLSQPVFFYVNNFLNFPVGIPVPTGYYDNSRGVWVTSDSGRIVKVLSITGGLAALDTDGDGLADNGVAWGSPTPSGCNWPHAMRPVPVCGASPCRISPPGTATGPLARHRARKPIKGRLHREEIRSQMNPTNVKALSSAVRTRPSARRCPWPGRCSRSITTATGCPAVRRPTAWTSPSAAPLFPPA